MMDAGTVAVLIQKEVRDATRNRWFGLYAVAFTGLALLLAWTAASGAGAYGVSGFGRTAASLINLVLLVVPLMGLTLGAIGIASDRERGALMYLLAQPVTTAEVLVGKFLGLALALAGAVALGFGVSGLVLAWQGGSASVGEYLSLAGLAVLLALATLGIGFLLSAGARKSATAIGFALFVWLTLAFLSDLGLMGTALALDMGIRELFLLALLNPLQVFKMAAVLAINGNLEVMGPTGLYALRTYGSGLLPLLLSILLLWTALALAGAYLVFRRRGGL